MREVNILRGERIRLTAVDKDDLPAIGGWFEDAGFARLFDATPAAPKSKAALSQWLEDMQNDKSGFLFGIRPVDGQTLLGYAELDGILWSNGTAWLGLGLGERDNWGQGFGAEAAQLVLNFAFNELNLRRVQLTVFSYNERAIALYEKLGFVREGVYREYLQRDGRLHDMILYGLLRREWRTGAES